MSHKPMSSNQGQQQQHTVVMSSAPGQPMQQRTMIAQRGTPTITPSKAGYSMATATMAQYMQQQQQQPSQQQQQQASQPPHLMAGYQKQMSPDLSQFAGTMTVGTSAQNGTFQSTPVSSLHSTLDYESGQLNLQHAQYQAQPHQASLQQYQQQTQQQQHYRQAAYQATQHSHQQHLQYPHKQPLQLQHQHQMPQQQQQTFQQLQQLQIQQHLHQRSLNQQQRNHQKQTQQAKQIPQSNGEPSEGITSQPNGHPSTTSSSPSPHLTTGSTLVTNGQLDTEEGCRDGKFEKEESSESEKVTPTSTPTSNASEKPSMANTKEKTPMCLINELARFNKMSHQYTLVDEQGPAHKKTFYVKLKLGDEEYSASGESIKKAQHAAAAIALVETKYQHPPPKPARVNPDALDKADGNITPTVELNALAMKRGEATSYKSIEPQQPPYYHQPHMDFRGLYNQRYHQYMRGGRDPRYHPRGSGMMLPMRYHYPRMSRAFYVSLRVGHREFIGDGPTRQAARHMAAQKALRILKNLPITNEVKKEEEAEEEIDDSLKSEISLVHEIALRRNMNVQFEVIRETGPPHMKNFVTRCTVSDLVTEGEGNSKKLSKKKAAEQMLEELHKLPNSPAPAVPRPKAKNQINKKKNRNIIKSELQQQKADPNYGVGINPISRLIQIMQAQKKKEPVYTLVAERGLPRRREFIVQVDVEEKLCTGTGPNKKLAKRAAAEAMLQLLGYTKPSPQPAKSSFKNSSSESSQSNGDRKMVTFVEEDSHGGGDDQPSTNSTQQRVPGLLHLPTKSSTLAGSSSTSPKDPPPVNLSNILQPNLRPEIQLRELCKAMNCQLEIDDFTKKRPSGTEHITRITIGSDNPQSFHGSNTSMESSRDMAALDALKVLLAKVKDVHPAGDGPQVKKELLVRASASTATSSMANK